MSRSRIFIGLVHYPVYDKQKKVVATSITNLDLHDIARASTTYNVERYLVIHPHEAQRRLAQEILAYWQAGYGSKYNPDRKEAFNRLLLVPSVEEAVAWIEEHYGKRPRTVVTTARSQGEFITYLQLRNKINAGEEDYLILLGTGWGLEEGVFQGADYRLAPIRGGGIYNHLSVRSAAAIIMDRLLGENWWG